MRFTKRTSVKVDLQALENNFDALTEGLSAEVRKCLVVKADAYGHGAVRIAQRLQNKADFLAVACAAEGRDPAAGTDPWLQLEGRLRRDDIEPHQDDRL